MCMNPTKKYWLFGHALESQGLIDLVGGRAQGLDLASK